MYSAHPLENVGIERFVERVIGVRRNEYAPVFNAYDDGGMIKVARRPAELDYVARFELIERNLFGKRTRAVGVVHEEVVEIFDARPGRRSLVQRLIKPAERGGVVHNARARVNALRGEVGAISAEFIEVVEFRISAERPFSGVGVSGLSVII